MINDQAQLFLKEIEKVALSLLGTPYRWGGATPMGGVDCSGFALILLKSVGIVKWADDMTADYMDDFLIELGGEVAAEPVAGSFIFYGSTHQAKHVMYCLNNYQCIGAQGGGSKTNLLADAVKDEAYVKILPYNYRNDIIHIIDIKKILEGISL
jgi:hypothetical protein